ncbi:MAG: 50S ribosomal protein L24 [Patescibacteria group bacterium]|jgi:large subunit ribosomal protein L24
MKIKTGDMVRVTKGKDAGKTGKIVQVFPALNSVVVEGVNKAVKHLKKRGKQPGQRVEFNAPIAVANVRMVGKQGEGRVGYRHIEKDGKKIKVRVIHTKRGTEDVE